MERGVRGPVYTGKDVTYTPGVWLVCMYFYITAQRREGEGKERGGRDEGREEEREEGRHEVR